MRISNLIGAHATIKYHDENETKDVYISFGEYDEVNGIDSYGVDDDCIFYYFKNLDEFKKWNPNENEFSIIDYELEYDTE